MAQRFQHGRRRHAALEEVERRQKLAVTLVSPAHAMLAARTEQSRIEHYADIVVGRGESCDVAAFAATRECGYRKVFARTVNLWSGPDSKAVAKNGRRSDAPGETHPLVRIECSAPPRV